MLRNLHSNPNLSINLTFPTRSPIFKQFLCSKEYIRMTTFLFDCCSCSVAQSQKVCNTKISFSWVSRSWSCRPSLTRRDRCHLSSHVVSLKRQKFANHWHSDTDWLTLIRKKRKFSCKHTSLFLVLTRNSTSFIYLLCTKIVKC